MKAASSKIMNCRFHQKPRFPFEGGESVAAEVEGAQVAVVRPLRRLVLRQDGLQVAY